MRRIGLLAAGAALVLGACGQKPPSATGPRKAAVPAPVRPPTPAPPDNQAIARELAGKTITTFNRLKSFRAQAHSQDVDPKDGEVYRSAVEVLFKAPAKFRLTVLPGYDNAGLKLAFDDGGDHVVVRLAGVLGFARLQLATSDSRARTSRGFPFMQITIKGTLGRLGDRRAIVSYLGDSTLEGRPAFVLGVTGPVMLPGVTQERIYVDRASLLPLRGEMRSGSQIVFSSTLKRLEPDAPIPGEAFDI